MPVQPLPLLFSLTLFGAAALAGCDRLTVGVVSDTTPRLDCRLEAVPPLTAGGPVPVRFTLTNRGDNPVWVLRWNTPLEERWKGTVFAVTAGGRELPYQGPMVKRGDPGREEYAEIPAGGSATGLADLAQVYALGEPGRYRMEVVQGLQDVVRDAGELPRPRDRQRGAPLSCPPLDFEVSGRPTG
jgi:hypothetical protein